MNKPREFWISAEWPRKSNFGLQVYAHQPELNGYMHVIEKSAYDKAVCLNQLLLLDCEKVRKLNNKLQEKYDKAVEALKRIESTNIDDEDRCRFECWARRTLKELGEL